MRKFVQYPESHLLYRGLKKTFPIITHGKGVFLHGADGKNYLDAAGGALVISAGHGNTEIVNSIANELKNISYLNGTQFVSEVALRLASILADEAKSLDLDHSLFLCSGSEAIEASVKFARQLWVERGQPKKHKVLARKPGYHGNTLYALSVSGRPRYQKLFGPLLHEIEFFEAPVQYRSKTNEYDQKATNHYVSSLVDSIEKAGAENVAALIVEPIIGTSAGGATPPTGYFSEVQKICRKNNILIIADEVLCGTGRVGTFFASNSVGLHPDILLLGKGLSSGYAPLSALMTKSQYLDEIKAGSGAFIHAQTFLNAPCTTAAGVATLEFLKSKKLIEKVSEKGTYLKKKLENEILPLPHIGNVSGLGLLWGIEFVLDKKTKKPHPREKMISEKVAETAISEGLVLWPSSGNIDGELGDIVTFGPPLTIELNEIDELIERLKRTIQRFFTN